jgi:single-stranded-DNA-specific exonuclease
MEREKRWRVIQADQEKAGELFRALKIHPALCSILVQRGITSFEAARDYFRPQLAQLHSPWLMKDMEKAVDRILLAFNTDEKILVYGDYDVDGTTAVSCMYQFLHKHYSQVDATARAMA